MEETWREILHEYVVYSLLFKTLMVDAGTIEKTTTKLRYRTLMELLSLRAERAFHHYRRELSKAGCKVTLTETRDAQYYVQFKIRGYIHEAFYSSEHLRAECEVRLEMLLRGHEYATGTE